MTCHSLAICYLCKLFALSVSVSHVSAPRSELSSSQVRELTAIHCYCYHHCRGQQSTQPLSVSAGSCRQQTNKRSMVKYHHGLGADTEFTERQRCFTSFNTVQTTSQGRRFAVTSETECMVIKTKTIYNFDHSIGASITGIMDAVTSGADIALQNKEEDRIQELAARPYQV